MLTSDIDGQQRIGPGPMGRGSSRSLARSAAPPSRQARRQTARSGTDGEILCPPTTPRLDTTSIASTTRIGGTVDVGDQGSLNPRRAACGAIDLRAAYYYRSCRASCCRTRRHTSGSSYLRHFVARDSCRRAVKGAERGLVCGRPCRRPLRLETAAAAGGGSSIRRHGWPPRSRRRRVRRRQAEAQRLGGEAAASAGDGGRGAARGALLC